jgi:hypothetical protein
VVVDGVEHPVKDEKNAVIPFTDRYLTQAEAEFHR